MSASIIPLRHPITTAPRNGLTIIVGAEAVGEFPMHWNPEAENPLFAPGVRGLWEMADRSMTWFDGENMGPEWWRPLS